MKITEHLVQLFMEDEWDKTVLTRESFPVNIRLYKNNENYRNIILKIVCYMDEHLHSHFEDYSDPRGIAAANLGFPFKIIGYRRKPCENQFCLNPKIVFTSANTIPTNSNCGSLRLPQPISVERYGTIDLEYYDLEGEPCKRTGIYRSEGGFTVQHEVDQINGITVIDRHEKQKAKKKPNSVSSHAGCC